MADTKSLVGCPEGPSKQALDRTKNETRYPDSDPVAERAKASVFLSDLNDQIEEWMFGRESLADNAILPFVRQFAFIDKDWFDAQPWPNLQAWLERFLASQHFAVIMTKYPAWQAGHEATFFPPVVARQ